MRIPIFPILWNLASSVVSSVGSQLFVAQKGFLNTSNVKLNESSEEKGLFLRVSIKSNLDVLLMEKNYVLCSCLLNVQNAFWGFSILIGEISKTQLIFKIMLLLFCVASLFSFSFCERFFWGFSSCVLPFLVGFFGHLHFMFCWARSGSPKDSLTVLCHYLPNLLFLNLLFFNKAHNFKGVALSPVPLSGLEAS